VLGTLQAAAAATLRALQRRYDRSQKVWKREVKRACPAALPLTAAMLMKIRADGLPFLSLEGLSTEDYSRLCGLQEALAEEAGSKEAEKEAD